MGIKMQLVKLLEGLGACKVRIANPDSGFENALPGCHPKDVMADCRSVIAFATNIGLDYYRIVHFHDQTRRVGHLYTESLGSQAVWFLRAQGYNAIFPFGYYHRERHTLPGSQISLPRMKRASVSTADLASSLLQSTVHG